LPERPYANVWQKMLLEEAEENRRARDRRDLDDYEQMLKMAGLESGLRPESQPRAAPSPAPRLDYDMAALPDFGGVTQPPPRLPYDFDLGEPLAGPGEYQDGEIVVEGRHPSRTVKAPFDCTIRRVGWENPDNHSQGYGYRAYCSRPDGSGVVVAHMAPGSIPAAGSVIRKDRSMGRYAVPANGDVTGAHLHRGEYDRNGVLIRPNLPPPFEGQGHMTSGYGMRTIKGKRKMHKGEDWIE